MINDNFRSVIRHLPFILVVQCIFVVPAMAQQMADDKDLLLQTLDSLSVSQPVEKVYLHTDKPYYAAGDTIWFKGYVVEGSRNRPSQQSGALYADLIDEADSVLYGLKLPLMSGLAKGSMTLSPDLPEGNYRIRSYTQWMRNAGSDFFYEQVFAIGNAHREGVNATATLQKAGEGRKQRKYIRLSYRDAGTHEVLKGLTVGYTLRMDKRYYTGSGQTGTDGSLLIDISNKGKKQQGGYRIESTIQLPGGKKLGRSFVLRNTPDSVELRFFPEGGTLVAGLSNRVAVKATDRQGRGLAVQGTVQDSKGTSISEWNSIHAGMGEFPLTPQAGESYTAHVLFPDGSEGTYPLPEIQQSGHVLSVYPALGSDSVLVRIQSSPDRYGAVRLLAQHSGEVLYSGNLQLERPVTQLYLPTSEFPAGVAEITLFNKDGQPEAGRIAFISRDDSLRLEVAGAQQSTVQGPTTLRMSVTGLNSHPVGANLSVSVTDESKVPVDEEKENSILAQLLLRSEVRGYIEDPGYYFSPGVEKPEALDLLLRTQGYRQYIWKDLMAGKLPAITYPKEPLLQSITGRLQTLVWRKPIEGGHVLLYSNELGMGIDTLTDKEGRFRIDSLLLLDSLKFTLQGRTAKGSDKLELLLDQVKPVGVSAPKGIPYYETNIQQALQPYLTAKRQEEEAFMIPDSSNVLPEVEVVAKKKEYLNLRGISIPIAQIDHIIRPKASDSCKTLLECILRWVPNIRKGGPNPYQERRSNIYSIKAVNNPFIVNTTNKYRLGSLNYWKQAVTFSSSYNINGKAVSLFYNGFPIGGGVLTSEKTYNPANIVAVYVREYDGTGYYDPNSGLDFRCFLYIETKDGLMEPPSETLDYQLLKPKGYSLVKEFYAPRYDRGPEEVKKAATRSTIYWNPDVRTDVQGQASFSYFNAGTPGTYRVVIEGISSDGRLGRKVFRYEVK